MPNRQERAPQAAEWLQERGEEESRGASGDGKDDLSCYLRVAEGEETLITRHGRPAGVVIGLEADEDWFEYRSEDHPEFLTRVAGARQAPRAGKSLISKLSPFEAVVRRLTTCR